MISDEADTENPVVEARRIRQLQDKDDIAKVTSKSHNIHFNDLVKYSTLL